MMALHGTLSGSSGLAGCCEECEAAAAQGKTTPCKSAASKAKENPCQVGGGSDLVRDIVVALVVSVAVTVLSRKLLGDGK